MKPELVGSILIGADTMIAEMVAARISHMNGRSFGVCTALGVVRNGVLLGGVVYHAYVVHDVQVSIAMDRPGWTRRDVLRALFDYPFNQLGVRRMTAIVGRKNERSRNLVIGLGFRLEGVHKKGLDGVQDAMSYGLLKENCKWIKDRKNGKIDAHASHAA